MRRDWVRGKNLSSAQVYADLHGSIPSWGTTKRCTPVSKPLSHELHSLHRSVFAELILMVLVRWSLCVCSAIWAFRSNAEQPLSAIIFPQTRKSKRAAPVAFVMTFNIEILINRTWRNLWIFLNNADNTFPTNAKELRSSESSLAVLPLSLNKHVSHQAKTCHGYPY